MKSCCIVLVAVLVGCTSDFLPTGEALPKAVSEAALAEWAARGMPVGNCSEWELRISYKPIEQMPEACHVDPKYWPAGCYFGGDGYALIIVSRGDEETLQHELRHWMGDCGGLGIDYDHDDDRYWYGGVR